MTSAPACPHGAKGDGSPAAAPLLPAIIGTGFGVGYCPIAPGTMGALLALVVWLGLSYVLTAATLCWITLLLVVAFTAMGIWAANRLEKVWGADPSRVVVDEMVGVWIPLIMADVCEWWQPLAALLLFRVFDIAKPLGVRRMERLPGGIGIMADDILAGIYSLIILLLAQWLTR